ncbi:hypothetical protein NE237_011449 [Protea cynaroides]|uniref:Uncharacterized protein n=1 Tax=Protea cynaroides TaxID=273540 RepID=A0A9Q0GUZ3_9MAGN|nr:hypothetical protein NE237_011449 [Protea cynaroides]
METKVDQLTTYNLNLEIQMGQLVNAFNSRGQGNFPSKIEINPKEQCKVITLRSGKQLGQVSKEVVASDGEEVAHEEVTKENETEKTEHNETQSQPPPEVKPYVPPIPFPQRLKQNKIDKQFEKFPEKFKQLHINIPFADALAQIPTYAKFLKKIMSNKQKLEDYETIALTEECSVVIQNKLPPKLRDPGSFSIPCTIGEVDFSRALCDLDTEIPIILGQPFLATAEAIIDVKNGRLTFKVEAGVRICTNHGCTRLEFTV